MISAEQNIITLLNAQKAQLNALFVLLEKELTALTLRNVTELDELTVQKSQLLTQIQTTDQQLSEQESLIDYTETTWFLEIVAELDDLLSKCKAQTQVNQQVLEQSQLTLERLKNEILATRGKSGLTYTNKGKPALDSLGNGIKA